MRSGLSIQDGVYIEEPVRTRVDRPVIVGGGFVFDGPNVWRKQSRQPSAPIKYEAVRRHCTEYAKLRCHWCGSTQTIELSRQTVSQSCPNCGGPQ
jgi:hypothetical protein